MEVLVFAISILSILATVGILFALMVRLASVPQPITLTSTPNSKRAPKNAPSFLKN